MNIYKSALHPDYIKKLYKAFRDQRGHAAHRNIEFKFTFEQWLDLWLASGHLHERGCKRGQYVMARYNDLGAYEPTNVHICTTAENMREGNRSGAARSAIQNKPEVKEKRKETDARPETKAKRSAAAKEAQNRPETKAKRKAVAAKRQIKIKTPAGIFPSKTDAAKYYGVHPVTMLKWIKNDTDNFSRIR